MKVKLIWCVSMVEWLIVFEAESLRLLPLPSYLLCMCRWEGCSRSKMISAVQTHARCVSLENFSLQQERPPPLETLYGINPAPTLMWFMGQQIIPHSCHFMNHICFNFFFVVVWLGLPPASNKECLVGAFPRQLFFSNWVRKCIFHSRSSWDALLWTATLQECPRSATRGSFYWGVYWEWGLSSYNSVANGGVESAAWCNGKHLMFSSEFSL